MIKLHEIAEIKAGHSFRGAINEVENGNSYVIQLRNVSKNAMVDWDNLVKIQLDKVRKEPNWLHKGDILFVARGMHNFATYLDEVPYKTVCVPHFFIIRITDKRFLPAFVSWQINQSSAQQFFESSAVGTSMKAINATTLKNLEIIQMPLETQSKVIELNQSHLLERHKYQRLMELREIEMAAISSKIMAEYQ